MLASYTESEYADRTSKTERCAHTQTAGGAACLLSSVP